MSTVTMIFRLDEASSNCSQSLSDFTLGIMLLCRRDVDTPTLLVTVDFPAPVKGVTLDDECPCDESKLTQFFKSRRKEGSEPAMMPVPDSKTDHSAIFPTLSEFSRSAGVFWPKTGNLHG